MFSAVNLRTVSSHRISRNFEVIVSIYNGLESRLVFVGFANRVFLHYDLIELVRPSIVLGLSAAVKAFSV